MTREQVPPKQRPPWAGAARRRIRALAVGALVAIAAAIALAPGPARAQAAPEELVRGTIEDALEVLRDPALQGADKRDARIGRLRQIADGAFDWRAMAQRSLGPTWRELSEAQRRRYTGVFVDLLAAHYASDFDRFRGDERITVENVKRADGTAEVETTLITHSRERIPIIYYVRQGDEGWQVYDLSVEGVSLANHYRQSFRRFLVNHSFEELMQRLETRQGQSPAAP